MSKHTDLLAHMAAQVKVRKSLPPKRKLVEGKPKRNVLARGKPLRVSAGMQARYVAAIMQAIQKMQSEVVREITKLYKSDYAAEHRDALVPTTDASVGSQARILTNKFKAQFDGIFSDLSQYVAASMVEELNSNSNQQLNSSLSAFDLSEAGKKLMLDPKMMSPAIQEILKAATAQSAAFIKSIPDRYINQVNNAVLHSIQQGNGLEELIPELEKYGNQTANWAHNTAMDQTRKTFNALNIGRMSQAGITKGEWIHSGGSQKPRPLHVAYDGQTFVLAEGAPVGDDGGDMVQPGENPNCFPYNSEIVFTGFVNKAYRRWYAGKLTTLITDSGKVLRATPNHPVLTHKGWQPISSVNEGDYVFEISEECLFTSEENKHQSVALIGDIFGTLLEKGIIKSFNLSETNFHGDTITNSNVDIVCSTSALQFNRITHLLESFGDLSFPKADTITFMERALNLCIDAIAHSASSCMSTLDVKDSIRLTKPDDVCFGTIAQSDIKLSGNGVSGDTKSAGNTEQAFPFNVSFSRAINVENCDWSGHVYNLETELGYYSVSGFIVHNCRCTFTPIIEAETSDDETESD